MLNTNTRTVKDRINAHILESVTDFEGNEFEDIEQAKRFMCDRFKSEYMHHNNRHQNRQELFKSYMQGLPFNFPYMNWEIIETVERWTESDSEDFDTQRTIDLYYNLIYREIHQYL